MAHGAVLTKRRSHRGDGARSVNPNDHRSEQSWWTLHAQPEDRENFMAEARARTIERSHQENVRDSKRVIFDGSWPRSRAMQTLKPLKVKPS